MTDMKNRHELLFIYDVNNGNPNGDPADENKPRIDEETGLNFVTDVRLKRTIRDYFFNYKGYNGEGDKDIFVRQTIAETGGLNDGKSRALAFGKKKDCIKEEILKKCIDVRLFGGVIPLEKGSITLTGPVQFKIGHSLHRVKMQYIKGTGAFASKVGNQQQTFREEYILPYSLIAFYGIVNENAAKYSNLSEEDLISLEEGIWKGTKNLITRSKIEHTPRLLIDIEYSESNFFIGELDKFIKIKTEKEDEELRDISELEVDLEPLGKILTKYKEKIAKIRIKIDERVNLTGKDKLPEKLEDIEFA